MALCTSLSTVPLPSTQRRTCHYQPISTSISVVVRGRKLNGHGCPFLQGAFRRQDVFLSTSTSYPRRFFTVQASKKTFSSFKDMIQDSELPVLVDFYATWCGPCQLMVPVLNEVGNAMKEEIRIVKIDSEKYPKLASRYSVQALPTFILFKDGKPIDRFEGAMTAPSLVQRLKTLLSGKPAGV